MRDKEETTWIPEEDPYVACTRIAQEVGRFMVKRAGMAPDDLGVFEYNRLRNALRNNWNMFLHHEDLMLEFFSDDQIARIREMRTWVEMCCNGASPDAAMYWLRMVPRLRRSGSAPLFPARRRHALAQYSRLRGEDRLSGRRELQAQQGAQERQNEGFARRYAQCAALHTGAVGFHSAEGCLGCLDCGYSKCE